MARGQIGNNLGVAAVGGTTPLLGTITAEGANTFTVTAAEARQLEVGMNIDFRVKSTGAVVASTIAHKITAINVATGVVTYDGADDAGDLASDGTEGVYLVGGAPSTDTSQRYTNFNGGKSVYAGLDIAGTETIEGMRTRLKEIAATTYTDAELDKMTFNDMRYAIRLNDAAGSVK